MNKKSLSNLFQLLFFSTLWVSYLEIAPVFAKPVLSNGASATVSRPSSPRSSTMVKPALVLGPVYINRPFRGQRVKKKDEKVEQPHLQETESSQNKDEKMKQAHQQEAKSSENNDKEMEQVHPQETESSQNKEEIMEQPHPQEAASYPNKDEKMEQVHQQEAAAYSNKEEKMEQPHPQEEDSHQNIDEQVSQPEMHVSSTITIERPLIKVPIPYSDIVKVGGTDEDPILEDWSNEIPVLKTNDNYTEYLEVWKERQERNKHSAKVAKEWAKFGYVTMHPRTNSTRHNPTGELFLQFKFSGNAINRSHPHFKPFEEEYNSLLRIWDQIRGKIKNSVLYLADEREANEMYPTIKVEPRLAGRETYDKDTFEYPGLLQVFRLRQGEDEIWAKIVSTKKEVQVSPAHSNNEKLVFDIPELSKEPIDNEHRLYGKINNYYEDQEIAKIKATPAEEIVKKARVRKCSSSSNLELCVEGYKVLGKINTKHKDFKVYLKAFLIGRRDDRKQELLDEIIIHDIRAKKSPDGNGKVYFDLTLNQGPIDSTASNYTYYENGWNLHEQLCGTNLACHDLERIEVEKGQYKFIDNDLDNKEIDLNHPEIKEYNDAWEEKEKFKEKVKATNINLDYRFNEIPEWIPNEGKLPSFEVESKIYKPGTPEWTFVRNEYLRLKKADRKRQIQLDKQLLPYLYA